MEVWTLFSMLLWWIIGWNAALLPTAMAMSLPSKDIHKLMTNYELSRIFGSTSEVPEYEIVSVTLQNIRKRRFTDFSETEYHVTVGVHLNNNSFHINLRRHSEIISKNFEFTVTDNNGSTTYTTDTHPIVECLYQGVVISNGKGEAALANCDGNGMTGVILMENKEYILQPLPERFQEQKALTEHNLHIFYPKKKMHTCGVGNSRDMIAPNIEEGISSEDSRENMLRRRRKRAKSTKYIETAVYVDDIMYNNIARDNPRNVEGAIKDIVFAMVNMVQLLYNQPSSGRPFKIVIVKLEILKSSKSGPSKGGGDIKDYLSSFCRWQAKMNPESDRNARHWDHAIMLSGLDLFQDSPENHKVIGLAWVSGMCRKTYSCSVNEGNTFESAFVITHELGHNLGMPHDGDGNSCDSQKYIMSPSLGPGKIAWSSCSIKALEDFISSSTSECLEDSASATSLNHEDSRLPGEKFSAQSQCDHAFGASYKVYTVKKSPFENICRELWCAKGTQAKRAHPALDGTSCGYNKICRYGNCVTDNRVPKSTYSGGREVYVTETSTQQTLFTIVKDFFKPFFNSVHRETMEENLTETEIESPFTAQ